MQKDDFPKFTITPINSITEGVKMGGLTYMDIECDPVGGKNFRTVNAIKLHECTSTKDIYLFYIEDPKMYCDDFIEVIDEMKKCGLKPCDFAPNYLLGLMAQVPEDKWPKKLEDLIGEDNLASVIAFDPYNPSSVFGKEETWLRFLRVTRYIKHSKSMPRTRGIATELWSSSRSWFYAPKSLGFDVMLAEAI